jgi:hypothetical protein
MTHQKELLTANLGNILIGTTNELNRSIKIATEEARIIREIRKNLETLGIKSTEAGITIRGEVTAEAFTSRSDRHSSNAWGHNQVRG